MGFAHAAHDILLYGGAAGLGGALGHCRNPEHYHIVAEGLSAPPNTFVYMEGQPA